ncbi:MULTISPECIES: gp53-like domain-containing protein [unclassified Sphingomonas]|uniref:gp53-like domain-containing protein n=1 Tax=unclassified Sphingomonas TaxID=196159 RepID=UPI00082B3666|nr:MULTISPECIES: hypothetical protein [unclassified Sphingomonas]
MHAIDTPGSIEGRFTEGNPAIGQRATKLGAAWPNDVQDNLLFLLEEAEIAPTKGRKEDVADAVKAIVAGMVGTGGGSVPTARQVVGGGLVTGGGDLSANRTLTVTAATAAQVAEGEADNVAITPAALRAAADAGLVANGYYRVPGGPIFQWRSLVGSYNEGPVFIAFPIEFPAACFMAVPFILNASANVQVDIFAQIVSWAPNGATVLVNRDDSGVPSASGVGIFAVGF